tara:strand:+ start:403 stop:777 length:375 start_codon:yes stop_codon:yes gene_type:complete
MGLKSKKLYLECETPLVGKVDKKFCNDMCRNSYNNLINKDANEYVRKVNVILRQDRRILSSLMNGSDKGKANKEQLLLNCFNFYYYTNICQTKQGKKYYFNYELGYLELEEEQFALVKKQDYVK